MSSRLKIGQTILSLRKKQGLTGEKLAEILSVSPQAVSKWENDKSLPETQLLLPLAAALKCSIDSLFIADDKVLLKNETIRKAVMKICPNQDSGLMKSQILAIHELDLHDLELTDISDLSEFENLLSLNLSNNGISDFSPLSGLIHLLELDVSNDPWNGSTLRNEITNTDFLKKMKKLKKISVGHTKLRNISFVKYHPELESINAMCNQISDISPLRKCPKLREIVFYSCRLWDIEVCRVLPMLESVAFNENAIRDLSPIENCVNLKVLNVHSNKLGDVGCLKKLTKLTYVTLDQNNIGDITVLEHMPDIAHLTIAANPYIHDVAVLSKLKRLRYCEAANLDLTDEHKEQLQAEHPYCKFVWRYEQ